MELGPSVIPELSLSETQTLILCNESCLTKLDATPAEAEAFEHLTLVVNCHQRSSPPGKYSRRHRAEEPTVICQAVHEWSSVLGRGERGMPNPRNPPIWPW